jgi:hypothetical protein
MRGFVRGVLETIGIVAAFLAVGLVGAGVAGPPGVPDELPYLRSAMDEATPEPAPRVWLVDGFNALHVALLRGRERTAWWTRERRDELLARVRGFDDPAAEVWVVFDGPHPAPDATAAPGPVRVAFARSADEWLLRRVREGAAGEIAVVTADRPLADRARARGARVV